MIRFKLFQNSRLAGVCAAVTLAIFTPGCHRHTGGGGSAAGGAALGGASGNVTNAGGNITVTNAKSAILGAKVIAPPGAVDPGEVINVKIVPEGQLPAPLPAGFVALGRSVNITKNSNYNFVLPITITLPYNPAALQAGDEPFVLYYDTHYNQYQPCGEKGIDTANNTISFTTVHCTSFVVAGHPGSAATLADVDTGFVPGVDSMFHPNFGSYDNPGGSSVGIAAFASWYFQFKKATDTHNLYDKYREGDANLFQDDFTAKQLITRVFVASSQIWAALWGVGNRLATVPTTGLQLINAMNVTHMPQIMLIRGTGAGGKKFATAVLVFKFDAVNGKFSIYDPNFPSETVFVDFSVANGFSNYTKANAYPGPIDEYCFDALSSLLSPHQFEQYYQAAEFGFIDSATTPGPDFMTMLLTAPTVDANNVATIVDLVNPVQVSGTTAGNNLNPKFVAYYINGGAKHLVNINPNGTFDFLLQQSDLPNALNSLIMIATNDPRQEWNGFAGYLAISVKKQGVNFFTNLGFETGDFTAWTHETHTWQNSTPGSFQPEKSAISTIGADPIATTLLLPYAGTYACRVNNQDNSYHISSVSQTAVVPNVPNPQLQFYWAAVLEDPQHDPSIQPYVDIVVTDDTSATVLYQKHYFANDPSYSGWLPFLGGSWKAIAWQVAFVDVSSAQGHSITIRVEGADCGAGGHGGYVYLDGDE